MVPLIICLHVVLAMQQENWSAVYRWWSHNVRLLMAAWAGGSWPIC